LYKIIRLLKEQEEQGLFRYDEFLLEWLIIVVTWIAFIVIMSWVFKLCEYDNYEKVVKENFQLKAFVDTALPVRNLIPGVLEALARCQDEACKQSYAELESVYLKYNHSNRTFWSELSSLEDKYTFENPWTFPGSTFFTISIITTIGYGTFTPLTPNGQWVVVFCSLPGIYLTIVFCQKNIYLFRTAICKTQHVSIMLMTIFSVVLLLSFIGIGGWLQSNAEGWSLLEGVYFCWVSFSTIGFGDYAPHMGEDWDFQYLILLIVGWHIVTFVISVIERSLIFLRELDWWNESHLWPKKTQASEVVTRQQQSKSFFGEAQVVKTTKSKSLSKKRPQGKVCAAHDETLVGPNLSSGGSFCRL